MKIEIRDVGGLGTLEHDGSGLIRIGGRNAIGKTSAAFAIGMCVSGNANPYNLNKSLIKQYGRDGSPDAFVRVEVEGWLTAEWRSGGVARRITGDSYRPDMPQSALEMICGITDPLEVKDKVWKDMFAMVSVDRTRFITALLLDFDHPNLTDEDLRYLESERPSKRTDRQIFIDWCAAVHRDITREGVDVILKKYSDSRLEAKHEWQNAASSTDDRRTWGDAQSPQWTPEGWLPEYEQHTRQELDAQVGEAKDVLAHMRVSSALDHSEADRLRVEAGELGGLQNLLMQTGQPHPQSGEEKEAEKAAALQEKVVAEISTRVVVAEGEVTKAQAVVSGLKAPKEPLSCPHCGGAVVISGESVRAAPNHADLLAEHIAAVKSAGLVVEERQRELNAVREERESVRTRAKELRAAVTEMADERQRQNSGIIAKRAELEEKIRRAETAAKKVAQMDSTPKVSEQEMAEQAAEVEKLERIRRDHERLMRARTACGRVLRYTILIDSIQKGRVHEEYRAIGQQRLRDNVAMIAKMVDAPLAMIDWTFTWSGRAARLCSKSEQWRASFLIRRALALHWGVPMMVADEYDVLDDVNRAEWNGKLVQLLGNQFPITIILCGTTTPEQDAQEGTEIVLRGD